MNKIYKKIIPNNTTKLKETNKKKKKNNMFYKRNKKKNNKNTSITHLFHRFVSQIKCNYQCSIIQYTFVLLNQPIYLCISFSFF